MDFVESLPDELSKEIFSYLIPKALGIASMCSRNWREMSNQDQYW